MDQDRAILTAAFAFRDRPEAPAPITEQLRALLPATIDDIPESERTPLSDRVLKIVSADVGAMSFFAQAIDEMKSSGGLKSWGGIKSPIAALVYRCPYGDQTGTRIDLTDDIPKCTKHNVFMDLV